MGEWIKGDYYMPPNDEDILMYYEPHRVTEFYYNPIVTEFWDIYADGGHCNTTKDTPCDWIKNLPYSGLIIGKETAHDITYRS